MKPKQQKKVYATNSMVQWQPRKRSERYHSRNPQSIILPSCRLFMLYSELCALSKHVEYYHSIVHSLNSANT